MNYVALRMNLPPAEIYGVASFYGMFSLAPRAPIVAHVCDDIACLTRGADKLCAEMEKKFGAAGSPSRADGSDLAAQSVPGSVRARARSADFRGGRKSRERVIAPANCEIDSVCIARCGAGQAAGRIATLRRAKFRSPIRSSQLRLLRRIGKVDPASLDDYRRIGGYEALRRAIEIGPEADCARSDRIATPGARRRRFSHREKMGSAAAAARLGRPHYVICNADESEPGTFKDRVVMEGDPFAILEGMTIAALAIGAKRGFIYIRGEYPLAAERLAHAITAARAQGFLGEQILGADYQFDIEMRRGAGAYICGEETALFNSIEGYRGEPRNKPPFPTQSGLFHQPTVVNNVETLINIPGIILEGGAAFANIGTEQSSGTRLFCLSGHVAKPGVYEVPFGATLREVIDLAGGVGGTGKLQAILLGGAAGAFVSPKELDTPLTFEGTRAIGATLGSGVIMLFDDYD